LNTTRVFLGEEKKKSWIIMKLGQYQLSRYGGSECAERNDCIIKWKAQDDIEMKMVTLSHGIPEYILNNNSFLKIGLAFLKYGLAFFIG
jgi:hypothetical protein